MEEHISPTLQPMSDEELENDSGECVSSEAALEMERADVEEDLVAFYNGQKHTTGSMGVGEKKPLHRSLHESGAFDGDEDDDGVRDQTPDLAEYFSQFNMPHVYQITVCRSYANHLASLVRPKKYVKRTKIAKQ